MRGQNSRCDNCGGFRADDHVCPVVLQPMTVRALLDEYEPELVLDAILSQWRLFPWGKQVPAMITELERSA